MILKRISLFLALAFSLSQILIVHSLVKLREEPFWANPIEIYENFAFGVALGFSLPAPRISAVVFLLFTGWLSYRVSYWTLRKLNRLIAGNQTNPVEGG